MISGVRSCETTEEVSHLIMNREEALRLPG
jgi:hypothetical protein